MTSLYDCDCPECKISNLSNPDRPSLKRILKAVKSAFKQLWDKGNYDPKKDFADYTEVYNETFYYLADNLSITQEVPPQMQAALKHDIFIFSAFKTHAQLYEASRLMLDADGKKKPYSKFREDILALEKSYNENYLEAEYIYAGASAQAAANWADVEASGDDYDLQYRTANDDKVRLTHRELHDITLPPSDEFWSFYYPPNGWRCRCHAVQVRKGKYERTDPKTAMSKGGMSLSDKEAKIFKYNPGKEEVIFPPNHPYTKVINAGAATTEAKRTRVIELKNKSIEKFKDKSVKNSSFSKKIQFNRTGIKEFINQPHEHYYTKNELAESLDLFVQSSTYIGRAEKDNPMMPYSHIFEAEIHRKKTWIICNEHIDGTVTFYSISDNDSVLKFVK